MRIKITEVIEPPKGFSQSQIAGVLIKGSLKIDTLYELVEIDEHTDQQRKLFNPLVRLYFNSLCFNYTASNWLELREKIKEYLSGVDPIGLTYSDYKGEPITIDYKDRDKIPEEVIKEYKSGKKYLIKRVLKSMSYYSKKQMITVTDNLIREMINNEVLLTRQGKKFSAILEEIGFVE